MLKKNIVFLFLIELLPCIINTNFLCVTLDLRHTFSLIMLSVTSLKTFQSVLMLNSFACPLFFTIIKLIVPTTGGWSSVMLLFGSMFMYTDPNPLMTKKTGSFEFCENQKFGLYVDKCLNSRS